MPSANWTVSAIFILWFRNNKKLLVNIVNLIGNKVYAKSGGGRQFSVFISENSIPWLTFVDNAVSEGRDNHWLESEHGQKDSQPACQPEPV